MHGTDHIFKKKKSLSHNITTLLFPMRKVAFSRDKIFNITPSIKT